MSINTKMKQSLKAKAHKLHPIVAIGKSGITENVLKELEIALAHHELIKIKVLGEDKTARNELINTACEKSNSILIQAVGTIGVLYRKRSKEQRK